MSDSEGRFTLATVDGLPGAVQGTCRVTLVDMTEERGTQEETENPSKRRVRVPSKYNIPGPNGLSAEVKKEGDKIELDIRS